MEPVLMWSGKYCMDVVENLILFLTVWKLVYIWQSYHRLCNVLFFTYHDVVWWITLSFFMVLFVMLCSSISWCNTAKLSYVITVWRTFGKIAADQRQCYKVICVICLQLLLAESSLLSDQVQWSSSWNVDRFVSRNAKDLWRVIVLKWCWLI